MRPASAPTSRAPARRAQFGSESRREQPALGIEHDGLDARSCRDRGRAAPRRSAARAASRKRRTRSRSTGFQVPPSHLRSLPTMTPSTSGANAAMLAAFAPVLSTTGALPASASRTSRTASTAGSAPAIGPETRIASASEETTAERARTPSGRLPSGDANSGVTFIEHAEVVRPAVAPLAQQRGRIGLPEAHVALVDARHDLAHECRAAGDRDAESGSGIPQVVDAERAFRRRELADDPGHRRHVHRGRLEQVRTVVLVAEQHAVDAFVHEDLEVASHVVDRSLHARRGVEQRRARQRRDVGHRDHGELDPAEDPGQSTVHGGAA